MIPMAKGAHYRLNLIRSIREREKKSERRKRLMFILAAGSFSFFVLSALFSALTIWQMEKVLILEKDKLTRLRQEYQKYTASKLIVDKSDLELLGSLQGKGIFWTRKLSAMAKHLPESYWITRFAYQNEELRVSGYGLAGPQQSQLMVLNGYVTELRQDTTFSGIFKEVRLKRADRSEDGGNVAFEISATAAGWKAQ